MIAGPGQIIGCTVAQLYCSTVVLLANKINTLQ